jgi:hypothetical protein
MHCIQGPRSWPVFQRPSGAGKFDHFIVGWASAFFDDFLDTPDNGVFEHDFDSVWMLGRVCENSLDDAFREFSGALVLLLHDVYPHAWSNLGSGLAIHRTIMTEEAG